MEDKKKYGSLGGGGVGYRIYISIHIHIYIYVGKHMVVSLGYGPFGGPDYKAAPLL